LGVDFRHSHIMNKSIKNQNVAAWYPWLAWGVAATFFFLLYMPRVSVGVLTQQLIQDFNVTAVAMGTLSALFLYPYVLMQIPVGLLVDRFGARWLLAAMALATGLGCALFASSTSIIFAQTARFVMGFSASFAFVGALKVAATWFPANRLGLLAGLTQAIGMMGGYVGAAPVAAAAVAIGWRSTLWGMAAAFAVLTVLIAVIVRDKAHERVQQAAGPTAGVGVAHISLKQAFSQVLRNPQSWLNGMYVGLLYAPTVVFAELWGVTYLQQAHGLSYSMAATANGLVFIGWGVGGPLMGGFSDWIKRRRPVMLFSAISGCILMSTLLFSVNLTHLQIYILLFLFGLSNAGVGVSYALAAEINPRKIAGTSLAFANMASVIIGASLQPVVGLCLDLLAKPQLADNSPVYSAQDFNMALLVLPISLALCVVFACLVKETHCRAYQAP